MSSSENKSNDNTVHLKVSGDISGQRVLALEKEFETLTAGLPRGADVVLDLQTVNHIDSRGISLFVGMYKKCVKCNASFSIKAGSESLRILTQIKLDKIIRIQMVPDEKK
jgi:anti-anti-sigma factor